MELKTGRTTKADEAMLKDELVRGEEKMKVYDEQMRGMKAELQFPDHWRKRNFG